MIRESTRRRQKALRIAAVKLVCARIPLHQVEADDGMILIASTGKGLCLDLRASSHPLDTAETEKRVAIRRRGYRVIACRTETEVELALGMVRR